MTGFAHEDRDDAGGYDMRAVTSSAPPPRPPAEHHDDWPSAEKNTYVSDELPGVLTRAQLANLPSVEPLITDTIDRRSLAVLAGHWGTGKSFLALDWACSVATGTPWQGREIDTNNSPNVVLYVVGEGAYGVHERIRAWEIEHQAEVVELYVLPRAVNLRNSADVAELCAFMVASRVTFLVEPGGRRQARCSATTPQRRSRAR